MDTILNQFDSNEAMLLMYLANELPAQSRAVVEQKLKEDAALRQNLEAIRASYAFFDTTLTRADEANALSGAFTAARHFGDAVRMKFRVRPSRDDSDSINWRRMNWVLYPVAAAAMLMIGMFAWYRLAADAEDPNSTTIAQWTPPLSRMPPLADINSASDNDLIAAFDSLIVDTPLPSQRELDSISYLSDHLEDQIQ